MSEPPLAAHLFAARQRAVGGSDQKPLSAMSPRIQRQYHRFAAELEQLDDARAELAEEQRCSVSLRAEVEGAGNPTASSLIALAEQKARDFQARAEKAEADHNEFLESLLRLIPDAYEDDAAAEGIIATWVEDQAEGNERTLRAMHQELGIRQDLLNDIEARAEAGRDGNDPANVLDDIVQDIRRARLDIEVFTPKPAVSLDDAVLRIQQFLYAAQERGDRLDEVDVPDLVDKLTRAIRGKEATDA